MIETRILHNRARGKFRVQWRIYKWYSWGWNQDGDPDFMPHEYLEYDQARYRAAVIVNEWHKAQIEPDIWRVIP